MINHHQPECAETFFNSVTKKILHRSYFHNDFIFVRPAVSTEYIENEESPTKPTFRAYYPGDRYVDVVGDDLYDIRGKAEWEAAEALYRAHPGKPFALPEWALWGIDDPSFVTRMARFVATHPRLELIGYYSGRPGSVFDLASKPRSLSAYRQLITPVGRS